MLAWNHTIDLSIQLSRASLRVQEYVDTVFSSFSFFLSLLNPHVFLLLLYHGLFIVVFSTVSPSFFILASNTVFTTSHSLYHLPPSLPHPTVFTTPHRLYHTPPSLPHPTVFTTPHRLYHTPPSLPPLTVSTAPAVFTISHRLYTSHGRYISHS